MRDIRTRGVEQTGEYVVPPEEEARLERFLRWQKRVVLVLGGVLAIAAVLLQPRLGWWWVLFGGVGVLGILLSSVPVKRRAKAR